MINPREVPIPERMRHLPLDPRGYPIFYVAHRNPDGKALFTVNNAARNQRCAEEGICPICGRRLYGTAWLCGGPRSAFEEHGAYNDPPMHRDCLRYALQVCPYLAAPSYAGSIGKKQAQGGAFIETSMLPDRPEVFVTMRARITVHRGVGFTCMPKRPPLEIEYWQHGRQLDPAEGKAICDRLMATPLPDIEPPKLFVKP